jgi:hypothetical protein
MILTQRASVYRMQDHFLLSCYWISLLTFIHRLLRCDNEKIICRISRKSETDEAESETPNLF